MKETVLLKRGAVRLSAKDYAKLRSEILRRDGWKCQLCGGMQNVEVHHKEFRSQSGEDADENLITLCHSCHASSHGTLRMDRHRTPS
jgi:5-methylcytosine-specific restriction endonuclease McrA